MKAVSSLGPYSGRSKGDGAPAKIAATDEGTGTACLSPMLWAFVRRVAATAWHTSVNDSGLAEPPQLAAQFRYRVVRSGDFLKTTIKTVGIIEWDR